MAEAVSSLTTLLLSVILFNSFTVREGLRQVYLFLFHHSIYQFHLRTSYCARYCISFSKISIRTFLSYWFSWTLPAKSFPNHISILSIGSSLTMRTLIGPDINFGSMTMITILALPSLIFIRLPVVVFCPPGNYLHNRIDCNTPASLKIRVGLRFL